MIGSIGNGNGFKVQADLGAASGGGKHVTNSTTSNVTNNFFIGGDSFTPSQGILPGGCFPPPGGPQPGVPPAGQNTLMQKLLGVVLQLMSLIFGQLAQQLGGNRPGPSPLPASPPSGGTDFVQANQDKYMAQLSPEQRAMLQLQNSI